MARPKRHNADYFSHDAGMRNDPKVKALRNKFGNDGYAVWCMMLEVLTASDYFTRSIDDIEIEILSADFGIAPELFSEILSYTVRLRLLQTGDNCEYLSQKLTERLQPVTDKRRNSANRGIPVTESTQSKVKESKVKESNNSLWLDDAKPEYLDFCESYFDMLLRHELIKSSANWKTKTWYDAARLMVERDGIDLKRMNAALRYLDNHIKNQYCPQAYSLVSFREKWVSIRAYHSRQEECKKVDPNVRPNA